MPNSLVKDISLKKTVLYWATDLFEFFTKTYFQNHCRNGNFEEVQPAEVVLIEGIMLFHYKQIREFCDMKLFIDCDADTRLARRVKRDTTERGRSIENIIKQYTGWVIFYYSFFSTFWTVKVEF